MLWLLWHRLRASGWETQAFLLLLLGWITGMSVFVVLRYYTFQTNAFDLGIFNQAFATTLQGRLFYETPDLRVIATGNFLAVHFNLLMFLLLPLYALAPTPQALVVMQTFFLGLGAVPVWLISNRVVGDKRFALLMVSAFLFNPAVLSLAIYDFHLEAFLPFFLGMVVYAYLASRWRLYFLFLALALITVDYAAVLAFMISIFHLARALRVGHSQRPKLRWFPLTFDVNRSQVAVLLFTLGIAPLAFYGTLVGATYALGIPVVPTALLNGFTQAPTGPAVNSPFWWGFWLVLFGSVLFMPFLEPRSLLIVLPWFVISLLSVPVTFVIIGYQYGGAFVAPYLVWGVVFTGRKLLRWRPIRLLLPAILVVSVLLCPLNPMTQQQFPGIAYNQGFPVPTSHTGIVTQAIALIPPDASVLTQNNLFPQVSSRPNAYVYLPSNQTDVEFVLADMAVSYYGQPIWGNQTMSRWLPYFLSTGSYGVVVMDDGVVLLEKGYQGPIALQDQTHYMFDYRALSVFYGTLATDATSTTGTVLARTPSTTNGTFFYGPYIRVPPGTYNVTFWMKAGSGAVGGMMLDAFSPVNSSGGVELASRYIYASDFQASDVWTPFTLRFTMLPQDYFDSMLECRGMYAWGGPFSLDRINLTYVGGP